MPLILNPTGKPIRNDAGGSGFYGSPRGNRKHRGIDFSGTHGQRAVAPITGSIKRLGYAYADSKTYRVIVIEGHYCTVKIMYVNPSVKEGEFVRQGQVIGFVQNVQARYSDCENHVHLEISDVDPLILT